VTSKRQRARKRGHAEIAESRKKNKQPEREKKVGRLKKARTHLERVPEREDPEVGAKKEIIASKSTRK
jgi:hypothetical protein